MFTFICFLLLELISSPSVMISVSLSAASALMGQLILSIDLVSCGLVMNSSWFRDL